MIGGENMKAKLLEPTVNREASKYLVDNYDKLLRYAMKLGVSEHKAGDLVNDVYVSLVEAENDGKGYDYRHGQGDDYITVAQFVCGRIKRYSKNIRFRSDIVEGSAKTKSGAADGNTRGTFEVIAASVIDGSDYTKLDSFQTAYALAATYDDTEEIDGYEDIRDLIDYCVAFESEIGLSIKSFLKNISFISMQEINKSLFDGLTSLIKRNPDFKEAFATLTKYFIEHKEAVEVYL